MDFEEFLATATAKGALQLGRALVRYRLCGIGGCPREARQEKWCSSHFNSLWHARKRGVGETEWAATQQPLPPFEVCAIDGCVHDGTLHLTVRDDRRRVCRSHYERLFTRVKASQTSSRQADWPALLQDSALVASARPPSSRGRLSLAALPAPLQREVRYALHRHASAAGRSHWRPVALQEVVDALAAAGVQSVTDPAFTQLAAAARGRDVRRIWIDLPIAARSLSVTADSAKAAGWFDPILVGGAAFRSTQYHRRSVWDLTAVTQLWLRDLLWEFLHDQALQPAGKGLSGDAISHRITGIALLSVILHRGRPDHGMYPRQLGQADAAMVKHTWDLWFREQIPLPVVSASSGQRVLTEITRTALMSSIRNVLRASQKRGGTGPALDRFIFHLPVYPCPSRSPRPRPLSYTDFQLLVSPDSLRALDGLDTADVGYSDIWLAQAFQGGRIGETLTVRLGCIGLVGAAQPYFWRDISKVGVIDYGMPCHLPVYERLLRRQQITLSKLRYRYRDDLDQLDDRGKAELEATWDREMPLFPRSMKNTDLALAVTQIAFRRVWTGWFEGLGLKSITTHQTRATLATSLLNNGAPPALVRQLLGHFSEQALAHYASYSDETMTRHLQKIWAAGPGMDKPGAILLRPAALTTDNPAAAAARIDLAVVPVEHGLCRYGPVIGGADCPWNKNCSDGPDGACEHFVLTGADLAYWERKRDAAYHFAEGAPTDEARDYILGQWQPWEPVLTGLRDALDELGLLEQAERLDLRAPVHDYFGPLFSTGWQVTQLKTPNNTPT
ncbi:tyrosine-type recombinase/integrase [Nocardia wallacei]|uniref:tyrosine-type recombinase/integrase n=1 Tax=Nocardia wallacei TaxID=480035 RepID=UPI0024589282|nr:tyrosine-type recombinase/integrase [Nocardia wallacei]